MGEGVTDGQAAGHSEGRGVPARASPPGGLRSLTSSGGWWVVMGLGSCRWRRGQSPCQRDFTLGKTVLVPSFRVVLEPEVSKQRDTGRRRSLRKKRTAEPPGSLPLRLCIGDKNSAFVCTEGVDKDSW